MRRLLLATVARDPMMWAYSHPAPIEHLQEAIMEIS